MQVLEMKRRRQATWRLPNWLSRLSRKVDVTALRWRRSRKIGEGSRAYDGDEAPADRMEKNKITSTAKELTVMVRAMLVLTAISLCPAPAFAQGKKSDQGAPNECKKIAEACRNAGFIQGDWKKGDGLWRDCVNPIVQGQTNVPGATKPLPSVDGKLVADCKAKHPKFGGGKVGSGAAR